MTARVIGLSALLVLSILLAPPQGARAQSVLERTPNLQGDWIGDELHLTFVHRMWRVRRGGENRATASTSSMVGYPVRTDVLLAAQYASRSTVGRSNELELFARWAPLRPVEGAPVGLAVAAAYNTAAESFDGEVSVRLPVSELQLFGSVRAFSDAYRSGDSRVALGAGILARLRPSVALAADVVSVVDREAGEKIAWSAGLQLWIPRSPHSVSFHATNAATTTLQGSSMGSRTMWGFDFTTPLTFF
ncbi:MAG: hypothetical protein WEG36_07605 [Gemmatimonadota bacterium]